jgi:hypothetical protein
MGYAWLTGVEEFFAGERARQLVGAADEIYAVFARLLTLSMEAANAVVMSDV